MSNLESFFLPSAEWGNDLKSHLKNPTTYGAIAGAGIALGPLGAAAGLMAAPLGLFAAPLLMGPLNYVLWAFLVKYFLKKDKEKKVNAILEVYGHKYSKNELNNLYESNKTEFNRLYKLASDEFFRKYVEEQKDHRKAQDLITQLHKRIEDMKVRLSTLEEKHHKYNEEISQLRDEIDMYEEIFQQWSSKK
jgi:chaperonin cofactor prefoldin